MTEIFLEEQIYTFVKTARVVRESQIHRFFRDWDKEYVKYTLENMLKSDRLYRHKEQYISFVKYLKAPITAYDSIMDAYELLCKFTSKEILWIFQMDYPQDLAIGTISGDVYIVSSFSDNYSVKCGLTLTARKTTIPASEEDSSIYIAVVHEEAMIDKISRVPFHMYLVLNPDGTDELYEA